MRLILHYDLSLKGQEICRFLAALYVESTDDEDKARTKAAAVLRKCFKLNPGDRKLASDLLAVDNVSSEEIITLVDRNQPPADVSEWIAWAGELEELGAFDKAIDILLYCERKIGKTDAAINESLVIDYFMQADFKEVCRRFESQTVGMSAATPDDAALIFVAYAISLAKTGREKEALHFSNMILKLIVEDGPDDITYALRRLGTGLVLTDIIKRCQSKKKTDWTDYDPLNAWYHE